MTLTGKFNRVQHQSLANHDLCCIPQQMEERCNIKEAVYGFHVVFFAEKLDMNFDYLFRSSYMPV